LSVEQRHNYIRDSIPRSLADSALSNSKMSGEAPSRLGNSMLDSVGMKQAQSVYKQ